MSNNEAHTNKKSMSKKGLTVAEVSSLWTAYQRETLAKYALTTFLNRIEDTEIHQLLEYTLSLSNEWLEQIVHLLKEDQYPIPIGFTEDDVNLSAPRLFSDKLYLKYIYHIAKLDMGMNNLAINSATRIEIVEFYEQAQKQTVDLFKKAKELLKDKGYYLDYPNIPKPEEVIFVTDDSFLSGWFGERRPLLAIEVAQLISNAKHNAVGQAVITGFAQVAKSKEIKKFFVRGSDIALKHLKIFRDMLAKDQMPESTQLLTSEVTDSNLAPFSDKFMLFFISHLNQAGIGYYGTSISTTVRRDIALNYARLATEIGQYAEDGLEILIKHGWYEQPPMTLNRKKLTK